MAPAAPVSKTDAAGALAWHAGCHICIDPESGEVVRCLPAPEGVDGSGMAHAEGARWIGDWDGKSLLKVDIGTGKVEQRLQTDRFVTGVGWSPTRQSYVAACGIKASRRGPHQLRLLDQFPEGLRVQRLRLIAHLFSE